MVYLVLGIMIAMTTFSVVTEVLNYRHRHQPISENVQDLYDTTQYQTSLNYQMANFKLRMVKNGIQTLLLVLLLAFGFFGWLESTINGLVSGTIVQTIGFLFSFYFLTMIIGLPFRYYRTFVIEEAYGFNKTTKKLFIIDLVKGLILGLILGGGMVAGLNAIYLAFEDQITLFLVFAYVALVMVFIALFLLNGFLIRTFNKLSPLEEGELKERINALADQLGFNIKRIYTMDASKRSTKLNAFFTGLGKTREVVLFDTLIEKMSDDEIVAVLAHELGHATYKDAPRMLIQQVFVMALYVGLIGFILNTPAFFTDFGLSGVHFGFMLILLVVLIEPIDTLIGVGTMYLSRKAEYRADAFAKKHTSQEAMQSALKTLVKEDYVNLTPHPLHVKLYYSHPPVSERLSALES